MIRRINPEINYRLQLPCQYWLNCNKGTTLRQDINRKNWLEEGERAWEVLWELCISTHFFYKTTLKNKSIKKKKNCKKEKQTGITKPLSRYPRADPFFLFLIFSETFGLSHKKICIFFGEILHFQYQNSPRMQQKERSIISTFLFPQHIHERNYWNGRKWD